MASYTSDDDDERNQLVGDGGLVPGGEVGAAVSGGVP